MFSEKWWFATYLGMLYQYMYFVCGWTTNVCAFLLPKDEFDCWESANWVWDATPVDCLWTHIFLFRSIFMPIYYSTRISYARLFSSSQHKPTYFCKPPNLLHACKCSINQIFSCPETQGSMTPSFIVLVLTLNVEFDDSEKAANSSFPFFPTYAFAFNALLKSFKPRPLHSSNFPWLNGHRGWLICLLKPRCSANFGAGIDIKVSSSRLISAQ